MAVASPDRVLSASALRESIQRHARYSLAQPWESLSTRQIFECVSLAVRDLMVDRLLETEQRYRQADAKHLYYLSIEYLPGRSLTNNLINLGIYDLCRDTLGQMGVDLEAVEASERDAALGNGGLGRLAACFLDSLATLDMPGYGYGINYEYGLFRQEIDDGDQKEKPDNWLAVRYALGDRAARGGLPRSRSMAGSSTASIGRAATTRCGWTGGCSSAFRTTSSSSATAAGR